MSAYDTGRWHAVAYDEDGYVFNDHVDGWLAVKLADEDGYYEESDGDIGEIAIVRGSAVPKPQSSDPDEEFFRSPGSHSVSDVLYSIDVAYGGYGYEDIPLVWSRAKAAAEALNAAGVA